MSRANVTQDRLTRDRIPSGTLEVLEELTTLDAELYRAGTQLYERRIADWNGMGNPSDPSADFPDAPQVSDLSFAEPLPGAGWWGRERVRDGFWFCWIGDTRSAWVDLAPRLGAERVVVEIEHAIEQSALDSLTIRVNGDATEHEFHSEGGAVVASVPVSAETIALAPSVRVELEARAVARPCDVDPASSDARSLSIAVRRIALEGPR